MSCMMFQLSLVKVTNSVRTVQVPIRLFYKTEPKWPLEKRYTFYPWFFGTMAVPNLHPPRMMCVLLIGEWHLVHVIMGPCFLLNICTWTPILPRGSLGLLGKARASIR